jgi:GNAT superfamily N-acetyltransferase
MMMPALDLQDGYYDLPLGKVANIATFLEMLEKPQRELKCLPRGVRLHRFVADDLALYRSLFRAVGGDLMWFSRLYYSDAKLTGLFSSPDVESFALMERETPVGLLELDFREVGQCEMTFYGLVASAQGRGLGRALMDEALRRAWARPIKRLWVHTCTDDGPLALPLYMRAGFKAFARKLEIQADPRLTGEMARTASPHIPIIE